MRHVVDWAFRSRETGRITIAQVPNASLLVFALASALGWAAPAGTPLAIGLRVLAWASLFVWAADELLRGVNPFRRALGTGVLGYLLATVLL